MKTKDECLVLVKRDIMEKHDSAWTLLFFSIIVTLVTVFVIVHYTFIKTDIDNCRKIVYGLAIIFNTFSIGYISAFVFYYFHDYVPLSKDILNDCQVLYAPVKIIYDQCLVIEKKIFEDNIPSENYNKLFAERIVWEELDNDLVRINPDVWKLIRLNSSIIEDCKKTILLVRSDLNQMTFITLSMSLDIYKQISQKNWALFDEDIPKVVYKDLLLVIKNFKKSLDEYRELKLNLERYIYFDNYKYDE